MSTKFFEENARAGTTRLQADAQQRALAPSATPRAITSIEELLDPASGGAARSSTETEYQENATFYGGNPEAINSSTD